MTSTSPADHVAYVDTSIVSPFARAGKLHVLRSLFPNTRLVTTDAVRAELSRGVPMFPALHDALEARWLLAPPAETPLEVLHAVARYGQLFGRSGRDLGEATVLAYAEVHGPTAVVDDEVAVVQGRARGVRVVRTLGAVARAIRGDIMSADEGAALIDSLVSLGGARFPCDGAGLVYFLAKHDQLP